MTRFCKKHISLRTAKELMGRWTQLESMPDLDSRPGLKSELLRIKSEWKSRTKIGSTGIEVFPNGSTRIPIKR